MRRREAQGRCPELLVLERDLPAEARSFEAVARAVDPAGQTTQAVSSQRPPPGAALEGDVVAVLDARRRHMGTTVVSVGTVSESSAHPREVLRPVITRGAFGFVLIHNHPSGDASPSRADEVVTRHLVEASALMQVKFLDHVIIGRPSPGRAAYYSFREAGIVP